MVFIYTLKGSKDLTPQEIQLLERIDDMNVPFFAGTEYSSLADIHTSLDVEIWDEPTDDDCIKKEVTVTKKQLKERINDLNDRIQKTREKFEQAVADRNREEMHRLECLLGNLYDLQSALKSRLEQLQKNHPNAEETVQIKDLVVLVPGGLYIASRPRPVVKLFRKTMNRKSELAITYIHEMMHAYYDADHSTDKPHQPIIEEPMTEFAMLRFVNIFTQQNPSDIDMMSEAERNVKSKKFSDGFFYYGFGHYLYETEFVSNNDGINRYRDIARVIGDSKERQAYEKCFAYIYPELTEMYAANMLAKVFKEASKLTPAPLVVGGTRKATATPTTKANASTKQMQKVTCNCTTDDIDEAIKQHIVPMLKQLGKDMSITIDYNSKKGTTKVSKESIF